MPVEEKCRIFVKTAAAKGENGNHNTRLQILVRYVNKMSFSHKMLWFDRGRSAYFE